MPHEEWLIRGARLLLPDGVMGRGDALISRGRIAALGGRPAAPSGARVLDARGALLAPGLIDLQINGAWGADFALAPPEAIARAAERLAGDGVTAFLPTLISAPLPRLEAALGRIAAAAALGRGARILGVHLEGPFLAPARRGAHRRAHLRRPSTAEFERLWRASKGLLRLLTLAPELPGAAAVMRAARRRGVLVSLGHTAGDAGDFDRAAAAGARMVTHLFNAMEPFHHRSEGAAGAALTDDRLVCGLIYDRVHVGARAAALALRAKGPRSLVLVSDAVFALGLGPGRCRSGGTDYELRGGEFRVRGGPLGGAVRTLRACAAFFARDLGLPLADAWRLASENPARLLGERLGLAAGRPADLVLVDDGGRVRASFVGGRRWK
ncbi:MAG: N-acetylglucosamine-6-phosphate deacetylase [Elusimicrobia bacterium]|nr:N-acetylglucosamine-6-phosphate deacetylase [Elusimicrobiota bacterium]